MINKELSIDAITAEIRDLIKDVDKVISKKEEIIRISQILVNI